MKSKQFQSSNAGRLDLVIKKQLPAYSRSFINSLIKNNSVAINSLTVNKPSHMAKQGDKIKIIIPPAKSLNLIPLSGQIKILYEDHNLLAIDKPAGLPVHPSHGHSQDTLINLLIYQYPDFAKQFLPINNIHRPGIVHRLDKDTSGIIVIAKNQSTLNSLQEQIRQKLWAKKYLTLALNPIKQSRGEIQENIIRDRHHRQKFTITASGRGKSAHTSFQVKENYIFQQKFISLLDIQIYTGRTHQIRVHLSHHNMPILGDKIYNSKNSQLISKRLSITRQLLHAYYLKIINPDTKKEIIINSALPNDFSNVISKLKKHL